MSTQKATTITVVLTILIIIALFGWVAFTATQSAQAPTSSEGSVSKSGIGTIASLLASNTDLECTFTFENATLGTGEGVALINKEGHVRSDATTNQNGVSTGLHVINDGKFVYTWSGADGEVPFGTILRLNAETTMDAMEGQPIPAIASVYTDVMYSCKPWAAEKTAYIPPPQVKFIDFALALQQIIEGVPAAQ